MKSQASRCILWLLLCVPLFIATWLVYYRLTETSRQLREINAFGGAAVMEYDGPGWQWLERRHYLGDAQAFNRIFEVFLGSPPNNAAKRYRNTSAAITRFPNFGDRELAKLSSTLATLGELERFGLSNCLVTDDGLRHLTAFREVEILYLLELPITDEGLKHVRKVKGLKRLVIIGCDVSEEGLDRFARETGVEVVRD